MSTRRILTIKQELLDGHPSTGAYDINEDLAAAQMNAVNRPAAVDLRKMRLYLFNERHNPSGTFRNTTSVWLLVEDLAEGRNITGDLPDGTSATALQRDAAKLLLKLLELETPGDNFDFSGNNLDVILQQLVNADAMDAADQAFINGLSDNLRTRGQEIGVGIVAPIDIREARAA